MSVSAPLHVPVELRRREGRGRWFRMCAEVSEQGLYFERPLPAELAEDAGETLAVAFHLPSLRPANPSGAPTSADAEGGPDLSAGPIHVLGRAVDAGSGDDPDAALGARAVRFISLDEAARARIAHYVEERVPA